MKQTILVLQQTEVAELGTAQAALLPLGTPIAHFRTAQDQTATDSGAKIGIWESSPGQFRRAVAEREFSHILQGWCVFTPDEGAAITLHAGDAVFFPAHTQGVWDIKADFRKTDCIF